MSGLPPMPSRPARGAGTARFFGALGLAVGVVAVAARRVDAVGTETLLVSLVLALALAFAGFIFVLVTLRDVWRYGRHGAVSSAATLAFVLITFSPLIAGAAALSFFPAIDDVSTDLEDPPPLPARTRSVTLPVRLVAPQESFAELQGEAYPDLAPAMVELSTVEAFALARTAARELGWTLGRADEPGTETAAARIEAEGRSLVIGIPEDIVIRISPGSEGTRIDLRSASRYPLPDLGENARNITRFLAKFREVSRRPAAD